HVVEHGWKYKVPVLVMLDFAAAAVHQHLGTFLLAFGDKSLDARLALGRDHRTHLDAVVQAIADLPFTCHVDHPFTDRVSGLVDRDGHGCREAALARAS